MSEAIRTTFCDIETVSCVTGLSTDRIYELVDFGYYLWVWNVSGGVGVRRELRFWSREINDHASAAGLTFDDVLKTVIPRRSHVPGQRDGIQNWEFGHLLRLSKPCLCRLRKELGIRGRNHRLFITQANIEKFFRRRWAGNPAPRQNASAKNKAK
jgi:hypothetical protein